MMVSMVSMMVFNDYLNISKVSTCFIKPNVILRKKIEKKVKGKLI